MYSVCICRSSGGNPGKSSSSFTAYKAILQPLSAHDGFWLLVCGVSVALGIPVSALLGRFTGQKLAARKVLHILAVGACALAMWKLESTWLLWAAVAAVYPALVWLVGWKGFWEEDNRPAWGILWFPPAMLLAWFLSGQDREITALSMGILAFSDAIAAWVGAGLNRGVFYLTSDKKSLPGSLGFFASAVVLLWLFKPTLDLEHILWAALVCTLLEAMGASGRDNLWIPVGAALALVHPLPDQLSFELALLALGCLIAFRLRFLTASGAVAAWLMAAGIVWLAGPVWLWPPVLFLLSGSLLGKLPGRGGQDRKSGKPRDHVQVWSNGGLALACLLGMDLIGRETALQLFLVSLSIASADTWSSELGARFGGAPYDILRWKPMRRGVSGGVSLLGTLAAFPGALLPLVLFPEAYPLAAAGFLGMLIDSLLGSSLQARFCDAEGNLYENEAPGLVLAGGFRWMDNDRVNLLSNLITLLIVLPWLG